MTVKQGADRGVACPTIASALDQRFISFLKDDRAAASDVLTGPTEVPQVDREQLLKVGFGSVGSVLFSYVYH